MVEEKSVRTMINQAYISNLTPQQINDPSHPRVDRKNIERRNTQSNLSKQFFLNFHAT